MSGPSGPSKLMQYRFVVLLVALVLLLLVAPAIHQVGPGAMVSRIIMTVTLSAMLLAAASAVCTHRLQAIIALSLTVPAVLLFALSVIVAEPALDVARNAAGVLSLGYVTVLLIMHLFSSRRVTFDTIAASLCVYLILGIIWSMVYALVDVASPGSFRFAYAEDGASGSMGLGGPQSILTLYFSFVTLTTLGYGDIVPASAPARMLAIIQAVLGQIYLAVLVARLVGMHIAQSLSSKE